MLRDKLQAEIASGNTNQFIQALRKMYDNALISLEKNPQDLFDKGNDMHGIGKFYEEVGTIVTTLESLESLYSSIFNAQQLLQHYNSKNKDLLMLPLYSFWTDDDMGNGMIKYIELSTEEFKNNMSLYIDEYDDIDNDLLNKNLTDKIFRENGYGDREHWYIDSHKLNEIDYMLDFLEVFLEEGYTPVEEEPEDSEKPDRYIPKEVKVSVWRRDKGQCVQCSSKEKLEYDHIIPVSKGGSNTERNIQLLCEKCNRQKSANIS